MNATALAANTHGEVYAAAVGPGVSECIFLFHLNAAGTSLLYSALLGGGDIAFPATIAALYLDSAGDCYVAGSATINVPSSANALQASDSNTGLSADLGNGFILEINPAGTGILYGTWFGPRYYATTITSIALDPDGSILFAGETDAAPLPVTPGAYSSTPSGGFVGRLVPGSSTLAALSYLPFSPEAGCGGGAFPSDCYVDVSLAIDSQSGDAYLLFRANAGGATAEVLELSPQTLGGASGAPSYVLSSQTGLFTSQRLALASPSRGWVVGSCTYCALGKLISSDAFQQLPSGTGCLTDASTCESAVLIQITDISPAISFVGSSASGASPFAAGQLVSIYGTGLGPAAGSGTQISQTGAVTTASGGTQVIFDNLPAPILYAGATQVNAVIPCEVALHASTQVVVSYEGAPSSPVTLQLSASAPGIFTLNGTGRGQGVVLNADGSVNSSSNPAARGSEVAFYATGIGPTSPCVDGQVYTNNFPIATLPVTVGIGNIGAEVDYDGQAPYLISGVAQVNAVIPSDAPTGIVPLTLGVNGVVSPGGVTMAVK